MKSKERKERKERLDYYLKTIMHNVAILKAGELRLGETWDERLKRIRDGENWKTLE